MTYLNFSKKNQGYFLASIVALFSIVCMSSCNKNDDELTPQQGSLAGIKFVHVLPGYTSLNFYIGNQSVTQNALLYSQSTNYVDVYSGSSTVYVVIGGTVQAIAGRNVAFDATKFYSLYATRVSNTNDSVSTLFTEDNLSAPATGKAKIRFVNLSKNTTLDLGIENSGTLVSNKAFNTSSDFIEIDPAAYVFQTKDTGTTTVKAFSASTTLAAGKIYTIISKGNTNAAAEYPVSIQVLQNL